MGNDCLGWNHIHPKLVVDSQMTDLLSQTSPPRIDESALTPSGPALSPFLPGTNIQYAFDSTSLGLLKTCPRLYQYTMIEGWQSRDESVHLRFGIEYHSALEHFDKEMASGTVSREMAIHNTIAALVNRVWDWRPDETTKAGKYKNRESIVSLVVDYLDHFNPDPATTYIKSDSTPAVELSFRFELGFGPKAGQTTPTRYTGMEVDMSTGEIKQQVVEELHYHTNQPYLLCGHLDRVVEFNSQLFVMDRKTTTTTLGPYYFSQYQPHNQMSLYTFAGRVILDTHIEGVIIDAAQIKLEEPNAFARGFTVRTKAQIEEWMDDLNVTLQLAEGFATANYWPMNDTSCDKFGGCKFRAICSRDPHVRNAFLKSDFDKLSPEHRWNPLRAR